jgi:hypothetical protein
MTIKVDDPAFFLPSLQAGWTEVPATEFHVAQGAQEPSAMITRDNSPFLGMIKTARLIIDQCLPLFSRTKATIKGRKHVDPDRHMTGWARD